MLLADVKLYFLTLKKEDKFRVNYIIIILRISRQIIFGGEKEKLKGKETISRKYSTRLKTNFTV